MELSLTLSVLVVLFLSDIVFAYQMLNVKAIKDKALFGYTFLNLSDTTTEQCLPKCLQDCQCMSFQICKNTCQLSSSNKDLSPLAFKETEGCMYFLFQKDSKKDTTQPCQHGVPDINCCVTSNPCQNKGRCEPVIQRKQTERRFKCRCPGYTGTFCQTPVKSCRGYKNRRRIPGKYKILDSHMRLFEVFCDFDTESKMAWTLIHSYEFGNLGQFQHVPFTYDKPVHEYAPVWDAYRISKSRMESIQSDSSKWRMTCRYDTDGLQHRDYVTGANDQVDILTFYGNTCHEVEYIDVRGNRCENCTAKVGHGYSNWALHIDSSSSVLDCTFRPSDGLANEDSFGLYANPNVAHRCSSSANSTSQTWFGGE